MFGERDNWTKVQKHLVGMYIFLIFMIWVRGNRMLEKYKQSSSSWQRHRTTVRGKIVPIALGYVRGFHYLYIILTVTEGRALHMPPQRSYLIDVFLTPPNRPLSQTTKWYVHWDYQTMLKLSAEEEEEKNYWKKFGGLLKRPMNSQEEGIYTFVQTDRI